MKYIQLFETFLNEGTDVKIDNTLLKDINTITVKDLKDNQEKYMTSIVKYLNGLGIRAKYNATKKVAEVVLSNFFKTSYGSELVSFDGNDNDPAWKCIIKVKDASNVYDIPLHSFLGSIISANIGPVEGQTQYKPYIVDAVTGKSYTSDMEKRWNDNYAVLSGNGGNRSQKLSNALGVPIGNFTPQPLSSDEVK